MYGGFLSHRGTPSHHPFEGSYLTNQLFLSTPIYGTPDMYIYIYDV